MALICVSADVPRVVLHQTHYLVQIHCEVLKFGANNQGCNLDAPNRRNLNAPKNLMFKNPEKQKRETQGLRIPKTQNLRSFLQVFKVLKVLHA